MFILLVEKDGDVYEYLYDNLEEAEARKENERGHCELICAQTAIA